MASASCASGDSAPERHARGVEARQDLLDGFHFGERHGVAQRV